MIILNIKNYYLVFFYLYSNFNLASKYKNYKVKETIKILLFFFLMKN